MENMIVVKNPLSENALSFLRDKDSDLETFRKYSDQISTLLISKAAENMEIEEVTIQTPLEQTQVKRTKQDVVLIPILRAGVALLCPALNLFPNAHVGFVGLERNEETAVAREYYCKLPNLNSSSNVFILDPMLATGGSVLQVLKKISTQNQTIKVVSVISAPEGIEAVHAEFPAVEIYTAAIDSELNAKKYIVPGLGDYGDRYFGT